MTPDEVDELPMSTIDTWIAYRQAEARRRAERLDRIYTPTEEPKAEYAAAVLARDRLKRDYDKWVGVDEGMEATMKRGLDAAEKAVAEHAPKVDPFTVAIGLLRLIAEDRL